MPDTIEHCDISLNQFYGSGVWLQTYTLLLMLICRIFFCFTYKFFISLISCTWWDNYCLSVYVHSWVLQIETYTQRQKVGHIIDGIGSRPKVNSHFIIVKEIHVFVHTTFMYVIICTYPRWFEFISTLIFVNLYQYPIWFVAMIQTENTC